ncbi:semaphorin-4E-like [Aplochiton taeniatus]
MSPHSALTILCGLFLPLSLSKYNSHHCIPRKTVPYQSDFKLFREEGIWNYSTMLLREDIGLLILGAREAIYALDINNISVEKARVDWRVTEEKQRECTYKGKDANIECRNYIRTMHTMDGNRMYVCGTNAFSPTCDYMTYSDGQLSLAGKQEEGKGKCPFDPFQRYASILVENDLYSATSINFLGSEPVVLRSSSSALRTEFKSSWLNEPNFIYMDIVPESVDSADGDDDKIYLFFSENAMEYDFYSKLMVSRVARVCKGDSGGQRTLQRKWTTFLKARLDCSLPAPNLPSIVQDVFLLEHQDWKKSVFYAVFTPQSSSSDMSAVCAYSVSAIGDVFDEGKFKTPVTVETSHVKWVMYSGEPPLPRPGACINDAARKLGMTLSLDLPDKTLQFVRDRPLMDDAVGPLTGGPLLIKKGAMFTRIVVDSVLALDGQKYPVMFIGTENGYVQKAVNYDGEMFIIEEIQLYQDPGPISILRLSSVKGQLYAGSPYGAVQMGLGNCGRYEICVDCVLARDPYCAWDRSAEKCSPVTNLYNSPSAAIQSLKDGDVSGCPRPETVEAENYALVFGNNIKLECHLDSNLAQCHWRFSDQTLHSNDKYFIYRDGLLILNASASDAGQYTCESIEAVKGQMYRRTMAIYQLQPHTATKAVEDRTVKTEVTETPESKPTPPPKLPPEPEPEPKPKPINPPGPPELYHDAGRVVGLQVAVALLSLVSVTLVALLAWNFRKGNFKVPSPQRPEANNQVKFHSVDYLHIRTNRMSNNNHSAVDLKENGEHHFSPKDISRMEGMGFINDESEI